MQVVASDPGYGRMVAIGILTLAPVAVAILMQNPALRQAIQMRAWHFTRAFCRKNAEAWRKLESIAATRYDIARL
jgi:hypothetical protein